MEEKLAKVKAEVERMHNLLPVMDGDNIYVNYADRICTTLEMYIDSLQEEPVNKIWHDASEKPKESSWICVSCGIRDLSTCFYEEGKIHNNYYSMEMGHCKWAYTDDILNLSNVERTVKNWKKPVSEELEEAINAYIGYAPEVDECSSVYGKRQAFKAGAEWQKERMIDKTCEFLKSYRRETGDGMGYFSGIIDDKTIEDFKKLMGI